jgi:hypothetical protein
MWKKSDLRKKDQSSRLLQELGFIDSAIIGANFNKSTEKDPDAPGSQYPSVKW